MSAPRLTCNAICLVMIAALSCATAEATAQYSAQQLAALRAQQQNSGKKAAPMRGAMPAYGASAGVGGARSTAGRASLGGLNSALTAFALDTGRLPTTAQGLHALLVQPPGVRNWRGPYIAISSWQNPLHDPWGSAYRYVNTSTSARHTSFMIVSNGPDRLPNTSDDLQIRG